MVDKYKDYAQILDNCNWQKPLKEQYFDEDALGIEPGFVNYTNLDKLSNLSDADLEEVRSSMLIFEEYFKVVENDLLVDVSQVKLSDEFLEGGDTVVYYNPLLLDNFSGKDKIVDKYTWDNMNFIRNLNVVFKENSYERFYIAKDTKRYMVYEDRTCDYRKAISTGKNNVKAISYKPPASLEHHRFKPEFLEDGNYTTNAWYGDDSFPLTYNIHWIVENKNMEKQIQVELISDPNDLGNTDELVLTKYLHLIFKGGVVTHFDGAVNVYTRDSYTERWYDRDYSKVASKIKLFRIDDSKGIKWEDIWYLISGFVSKEHWNIFEKYLLHEGIK